VDRGVQPRRAILGLANFRPPVTKRLIFGSQSITPTPLAEWGVESPTFETGTLSKCSLRSGVGEVQIQTICRGRLIKDGAMQDYRRERHSISRLIVHLVCVTKYRRKVFDAAALEWLAGHARQVFAKMDCRLLASDGEADHLHILLEYPPKLSVSVLVNAFKGTSSRMLRRNRPDIASRYRDDVLWSPAYFAAAAGGAPSAIIKQYVEQQRQRASSSP
jgi:putative transposase